MLISKYLHQTVGDTITIFVLFNTESHDLDCKADGKCRTDGYFTVATSIQARQRNAYSVVITLTGSPI